MLSTSDSMSLLPAPGTASVSARRRFRTLAAGRANKSFFLRAGTILVCISVGYLCLFGSEEESLQRQAGFRSRSLLEEAPVTTDSSSADNVTDSTGNVTASDGGSEFPEDLFTEQQLKDGAVTLHIIGIIYMFYALALVCDEFFVPSLDVITEKLGISPDVAGATFMAAGGSAPELFTSIIGVFIAKSDVGIGTIVGSAVFNILFVIAACAFAAKEALSLTAWPLIRDVFFYSVSLIVLVVFFLDEEILWWEALILFCWYGAYVGFMKFNEPVEDGLRACLKLDPIERDNKVRGVTLRAAQNRKGLYHLMNETINPGILKKPKRQQSQATDGEEMKPLNENKGKSVTMIGEDPTGGISQLKNHLQETEAAAAAGGATAAPNANGDNNEVVDVTVTAVAEDGTAAKGDGGVAIINNGPAVPADGGEDDDGEEPIDMSFPKGGGCTKIFLYLISFPIMAPLYLTLPDTKNPAKRKFFVITFLGSIVWIALYSYLMVWWATVAGDTIGIPAPVMGLTFLAAGTSVPDLITSVLVAKQGKGDMAVSSSVGSNIFDVTVGLPLPWLLYCAVNGKGVAVSSSGVGCSISLLFLMLLCVFFAILIFNWKMTKGMGVLMLMLYVVFVIVSLGFSYEWYSCPLG